MSDLVDLVWRLFPDQFRLKGYDLPNNAYVESKVYGSKGLVFQKLLEQLPGTKNFCVTKAGHREAGLLRGHVLPDDYLPFMPNTKPKPKPVVKLPPPEPTPIEKPLPEAKPERTFEPPLKRNPFANHYSFR